MDEAHGAHLRWIGIDDAVSSGADVVIQSLHKTMPALTQTALLHVNGTIVDRERIRKMLAVYQTSSPSYVLMASISLCMSWLEREGKAAFAAYADRIRQFRERMADLKNLYIYQDEHVFDWGKLVISTDRTSIHGRQLYDWLRDDAKLQMEMVSAEYVLAMSTVGDSQEGLDRLEKALRKMDETLENRSEQKKILADRISAPKRQLENWETLYWQTECVPLEQAEGRCSSDYLYLYPPGIPILVPGEVFGREQIEQIQFFLSQGLDVHGGYIKESGDVKVILHHGEKCIG